MTTEPKRKEKHQQDPIVDGINADWNCPIYNIIATIENGCRRWIDAGGKLSQSSPASVQYLYAYWNSITAVLRGGWLHCGAPEKQDIH